MRNESCLILVCVHHVFRITLTPLLPTSQNGLSVFDHFVELALKGLTLFSSWLFHAKEFLRCFLKETG